MPDRLDPRPWRGTNGPMPAETLLDRMKVQTAPYKYPRKIVFFDRLGKTATGKLQRFILRHPETQP